MAQAFIALESIEMADHAFKVLLRTIVIGVTAFLTVGNPSNTQRAQSSSFTEHACNSICSQSIAGKPF